MEFIPLAQALQHIDSGQAFDIEVVTCDVKRGTGGELKAYARCRKHLPHPGSSKGSGSANPTTAPKNPNHYQNSTRNIYLMHSHEVKTVHIRLITRLNGKLVS